MTDEEIEKAKEDLKFFNEGDYITREMQHSAEVLEKYIEQLEQALQEQQEENKKKDKIIEEMAKFMTNKDIDEDICRYQVAEHCKDEEYGVTTNVCINCIKQYFENKAKE